MTRINLLPWREERRQELQRQFFSILGGVAVLAGLCVYVVYAFYSGEVSSQIARNKYVESEIAELEIKISEIRELQDRRDQIVDSMKVIQELQGNRPVIVHSMEAIASTIPKGVYYTKIEKTGLNYKMFGIAETNNRISKLMRNLDESDWFKNPVLVKVTVIKDANDQEKANSFELMVTQETPADDQDQDQDQEQEQKKGRG